MQLRCMILINNLTSSNVYYLSGNLQVKNEPTEQHCTNCFVFIFAESIGRVTQIILPGNHENIFYLSMITDTNNWCTWKKI